MNHLSFGTQIGARPTNVPYKGLAQLCRRRSQGRCNSPWPEIAAQLKAEYERWRPIVKASGFNAD